jgi:hypothetical protein
MYYLYGAAWSSQVGLTAASENRPNITTGLESFQLVTEK